MKSKLVPLFLSIGLMTAVGANAQVRRETGGGKEYLDSRRHKVWFPLGELSFADEVVAYQKGKPGPIETESHPEAALGPPDWRRAGDGKVVTLGCGGVLTLRFVDNALVDVEGPDLYIFEVGPDIEPTDLSISKDGQEWIRVGKISGGTAAIDIAPYVKTGDVFHYVRLTDLKSECHGKWPGADIDAVGAIGSGLQISLNASVLFDIDKSLIKPEAGPELHRTAQQIKEYPGARVVIAGHTDSVGSAEHNQKLSESRATAVRDYLRSAEDLKEAEIETAGYGATRPLASNGSEEGRAKNRRVEIVVIPPRKKD